MHKYFALFRLSAIHTLKNYKVLIGLSLFLLTCLLIFSHLWKVVASRSDAFHMNAQQLLWYIALNEWLVIAIPDSQEEMEQDLRSGRLAYLLPRPISYLGATFAESLGILIVNLITLGGVTFLFTWLFTGSFPFTFLQGVCICFLSLFAGAVGILLQMIIGVSAFWLQVVSPFNLVLEKLLFTLGGLILPLFIYPEWMQTLAKYTPFPAMLGERSSLAIHFSLSQATSICSWLLVWALLASIFLAFLYRRGLKSLNIAGG